MKKLYTLIAAVLTTATISAQSYDLQISLVTPASGASVVGQFATNVDFSLTNNGPDAILAGDTLWFGYFVGASLFSLDGVSNQVSGVILPTAFSSGMSITAAQLGGLTINLGSITAATQVCIDCFGVNGAIDTASDPFDTDFANNEDCFTATPPANVGLTEATIETSVYPNPASNVLNITSADEVSSVAVITMDGKVVANSKTTKVDVSALVSGVYIYEVSTTSGKVSRGTFMKN